jgi:hypothetical protein
MNRDLIGENDVRLSLVCSEDKQKAATKLAITAPDLDVGASLYDPTPTSDYSSRLFARTLMSHYSGTVEYPSPLSEFSISPTPSGVEYAAIHTGIHRESCANTPAATILSADMADLQKSKFVPLFSYLSSHGHRAHAFGDDNTHSANSWNGPGPQMLIPSQVSMKSTPQNNHISLNGNTGTESLRKLSSPSLATGEASGHTLTGPLPTDAVIRSLENARKQRLIRGPCANVSYAQDDTMLMSTPLNDKNCGQQTSVLQNNAMNDQTRRVHRFTTPATTFAPNQNPHSHHVQNHHENQAMYRALIPPTSCTMCSFGKDQRLPSSELPYTTFRLPINMNPPSNTTCNTEHAIEPCTHVPSWRRIRSKKGYNHFGCELCGLRWRIMTMKKRLQLFMEKENHLNNCNQNNNN